MKKIILTIILLTNICYTQKRLFNMSIMIFFVILSSSCEKSPSTLCIINDTKNTVQKLIVNPSNKKNLFYNIKPGSSNYLHYICTKETDFFLQIYYDNGYILKTNIGYITPGFVYNSILSLQSNNNLLLNHRAE